MTGRGVWVTGPSRSGTSMTAGLFAAHGIWWGDHHGGDRFNPLGYFEHPAIIRRVELDNMTGWPDAWFQQMRIEGWKPGEPWGIKRGPKAWKFVRRLEPVVLVLCQRPAREIVASRVRWGHARNTKKILRAAKREIRNIEKAANADGIQVVKVNTSLLVQGDYRRILPAFDALGVEFDPAKADAWIDPTFWNRGLKGASA